MQHIPRWAREPSDEIPSVLVIEHDLTSNDRCKMYVDSMRVYRDRVYLRIGIKFCDRESWREAAFHDDVFMAPDTIRAQIKYQDGGSVDALSLSSLDNLGLSHTTTPSTPNILVLINTRGARLEWFADYLIFPLPVVDIIFAAGFPKMNLSPGAWTLVRRRTEEHVELAAQYTEFYARAAKHGHSIKSGLIDIIEISARLTNLNAKIILSEDDKACEPFIRIPLKSQAYLSIHKIIPTDPIEVRLSDSNIDCYLLEVSGNFNMQAIAFSDEVVKVTQALASGLTSSSLVVCFPGLVVLKGRSRVNC